MHRIQALIFDLDGTLIDTAPDLLIALNHVLIEQQLAPVSLDTIHQTVGQGARAMLEQVWSTIPSSTTPDSKAMATMVDSFLNFYGSHLTHDSQPYPGVVDSLETLHTNGYRLSVCTNKPEIMAQQILRAMRIDKLFESIHGYRYDDIRKPDPQFLQRNVVTLNVRPQSCVLIGDSMYDAQAAQNLKMDYILFTGGYGPIRDHQGDWYINNFADLPALLTTIDPPP